MTVARRWRIFYLVVVELAQKYTKALIAGFVSGLVISLVFWKLYPFIKSQWLTPVERIGVVGSFTPNTLPDPIQSEISFGLTDIGSDGSPLPGLATTWVATDSGKVFTFFLRKDLTWHNNKHVVASDVNYNIKNVKFTVLDDHTIKAELGSPFSPFPTLVSKPLFLPGLIGFGDYKVAGITLNGNTVDYLKLVPSDINKKHGPSKEYRFYQTEADAITGFKLGDVDELQDLTSPYSLKSWGKTEVKSVTRYSQIVTLFFNLSDEIVADRTFRHTLAQALPTFTGERAISPISKTSWAYTDNVKIFDHDLAAAKKQITSEKISSESAHLVISTFPQYVDVAQNIATNWKQIGLPTDVRVVNSLPNNYQILLSVQAIPPDPDQYLFWHSTQTATNITGFSNVKIDKLLEDGRQDIDTADRKKIYEDFQKRLVDEAPALFLYYTTSYEISRTR